MEIPEEQEKRGVTLYGKLIKDVHEYANKNNRTFANAVDTLIKKGLENEK